MRAIVAMDPNRVIGNHGRIPWHISEDFKWFKEITMGCPLVMGRSTFESIGKPLPGRFTYILTNDPAKLALPKGELCQYVNKDGLFHIFNQDLGWQMQLDDLWVCGGARVYQEFLPLCNDVYVSHIMECYEGDTFMPQFENDFPQQEVLRHNREFWVCKHSKLPVVAPRRQREKGHIQFVW